MSIIALSATVGNSDSVANWLKANLVKSEWRPVELQSGTVNGLGLKIHRIDGMIERICPRLEKYLATQIRILEHWCSMRWRLADKLSYS